MCIKCHRSLIASDQSEREFSSWDIAGRSKKDRPSVNGSSGATQFQATENERHPATGRVTFASLLSLSLRTRSEKTGDPRACHTPKERPAVTGLET